MRFDDTLETVLAGDLATPYGAQSAWRQIVDLIGRRRVQADTRAMSTLRAIRKNVPTATRVSTARALEFANPPPVLVRLFALDDLPIALPVLRSARMRSAEWIELLPDLAPAARSILRNRRDLGPVVKRALESFGPIDFVLSDQSEKPAESATATHSEPQRDSEAVDTETCRADDFEAVAEAAFFQDGPFAGPLATDAAEIEPEFVSEPILLPLVKKPELIDGSVEFPVTEFAFAAEYDPDPVSQAGYVVAPAPEVVAPVSPLSLSELLARIPQLPEPPAKAEAQGLELQGLEPVADPAPAPEEADYSFITFAAGAAAVDAALLPDLLGDSVVDRAVDAAGAGELPTGIASVALSAIDGHDLDMEQGNGISEFADSPEAVEINFLADSPDAEGPFQIAEVVARIDAFWRDREENGAAAPRALVPSEQFRFESDAKGILRWVDGVSRCAVIGISLDAQGAAVSGSLDVSRVDGVATGAFRRRAAFSNARLSMEGESDAAGDWLISGIPVFDPDNGRFSGYRGTARRPRADERAEPVRPAASLPADSLRQLVHELRTPTNAIAGFAEMIETQMLGPVSDGYRERANVIRVQAKELLGAIDDLDLAARIDSAALALIPGSVALRPLLAEIADDLTPLADLRGASLRLSIVDADVAVLGDRRAVERLLARLLATLVSASAPDEVIGVEIVAENGEMVAVAIDRPRALADYPGDSVLGIDDERDDETLLGTGFALRLARNLARELGGALGIEAERLTLRLPAFVNTRMGQAHLS